MTNVIPLQRTYTAKTFSFNTEGLEVKMSGTLDGFVDLNFSDSVGEFSVTFNLSLDEVKTLSDNLNLCLKDVQENCLYDKDSLLIK
jgi:hypothetical protein